MIAGIVAMLLILEATRRTVGWILPAVVIAFLLYAYFGGVTPEHERALILMRFMSDFREAMWGVVQQALSDLDFDFRAYAEQHFERLQRTADERAFRRALG